MQDNLILAAFLASTNKRTFYPLENGDYKFDEFKEGIKSIRKNLDRVIAYKNGDHSVRLNIVSISDIGSWEQNIPEGIATSMGYNLLPSIRAFIGDGIPEDTVQTILETYTPKIAGFLNRLQALHNLFQTDYDAALENLRDLLVEMEDVCDEIMRDALVGKLTKESMLTFS